MDKSLQFDKTKWPRAATQYRWSAITGISVITLQKARERQLLPATPYHRGLNVVYKIKREDFEAWLENYYKPNVNASLLRTTR
jgi:hypothetical protein